MRSMRERSRNEPACAACGKFHDEDEVWPVLMKDGRYTGISLCPKCYSDEAKRIAYFGR